MSHLHDLVLEGGKEEVDDLVLLDGQGVKVDLLHGLDLAGLHKATELGHGLPLLLLALCAATGATTATAFSATTGSKSTSVGHFDCVVGMSEGLVVIGGVVVAAGTEFRSCTWRKARIRRVELSPSLREVGACWPEADVGRRQQSHPNPFNLCVSRVF
jgi:hypothetical protein